MNSAHAFYTGGENAKSREGEMETQERGQSALTTRIITKLNRKMMLKISKVISNGGGKGSSIKY